MLILAIVALFIIQTRIKKPEEKNRLLVLTIIVIVILAIFGGGFIEQETFEITEEDLVITDEKLRWQEDYAFLARTELADYEAEIADTNYYDYNDLAIAAVSQKIAKQARDAEEAADDTVRYVFKQIQYVSGEANSACILGEAPDILLSGKGQCDTMSLVAISTLRKMGIAARPVGGCIIQNPSCALQAFIQSAAGIPQPQFQEIDIDEEDPEFGRAAGREANSGLHAWITVWLPGEGWVPYEVTQGLKANTDCWFYHVELYPENNQKEEICVTKNYEYAKSCALGDVERLNQFGLGLTGNVEPQ